MLRWWAICGLPSANLESVSLDKLKVRKPWLSRFLWIILFLCSSEKLREKTLLNTCQTSFIYCFFVSLSKLSQTFFFLVYRWRNECSKWLSYMSVITKWDCPNNGMLGLMYRTLHLGVSKGHLLTFGDGHSLSGGCSVHCGIWFSAPGLCFRWWSPFHMQPIITTKNVSRPRDLLPG